MRRIPVIGHRRFRSRVTYANVASSLALFVAVSTGGAYAANTIGSADVIDESLQTQDLQNGQVKNLDLGADSVTFGKIQNGTITNADYANNSVSSAKIADGGVGNADLAANSVTFGKILNGTVTAADLAPDSVTNEEMAANAVSGAEIEDNTVLGQDLAAESVSSGRIQTNAIGSSEVAPDAIGASEVEADAIGSGEIADFDLSNEDVGVLFAQVNANGTLAGSSGGATSSRLSEGTYEVDFGHSMSGCAFVATQGEAGSGSADGAIMGATDRNDNPEAVFVTTRTHTGAVDDLPFQLIAVC